MSMLAWVQLIMASPVVLWAGWPFFERAWQSIRQPQSRTCLLSSAWRRRRLLVQRDCDCSAPRVSSIVSRRHGNVPVYFEAAAVITTLVLLGQVLELRARGQTGTAIKALLGLAPKQRAASRRWH
jgi:Cu+-exporting ATPase